MRNGFAGFMLAFPFLNQGTYSHSRRANMRANTLIAAVFAIALSPCAAESNLSTPLSSHQILPNNFKPPQVFKNTNLVRNVNLEKGYVRESINVVIENTDSKPQDEYYIPFRAEEIGRVGGLEVRDKKDVEKQPFLSETVEYDTYRYEYTALNEWLKSHTHQTI